MQTSEKTMLMAAVGEVKALQGSGRVGRVADAVHPPTRMVAALMLAVDLLDDRIVAP